MVFTFLMTLPFSDLDWVFYLALSGLISSSICNGLLFLHFLRNETIRNSSAKDWLFCHYFVVIIVMFFSMLNTQNGTVLTSEIFGLSMFSAPMSKEIKIKLKSFSMISIVFYSGTILFCQVYTSYYLQTIETMASLGFIFTAICILFHTVKRSFYIYKKAKISKKMQSSEASMETEMVPVETDKDDVPDRNASIAGNSVME